MTKTEFRTQFKRLRTAGYRLPVWDGITVDDVLTEWFDTFGACSAQEFSAAIDKLKQVKTDTFWPATGELWTHIFAYRKERRIRRSAQDISGEWSMSDGERDVFLAMLRDTRDRILAKNRMPSVTVQEEPQAIQDEQALRDEDLRANGEIA